MKQDYGLGRSAPYQLVPIKRKVDATYGPGTKCGLESHKASSDKVCYKRPDDSE